MGRLAQFALVLALAARAEIVDRIVASVGKQIVTLSDVQGEYRARCFLEGKEAGACKAKALALDGALDAAGIREVAGGLVDQALLRREMETGEFPRAAPETVEAQMEKIRGSFSDAAAYRAALQRYGLEEQDLRRRLQFQADVQRFLDHRFRPGVQVAPEEVERYYRESLLPELRRQGAHEPALQEVKEKIAALLVERRINERLAAWMEELRGQAGIRLR